MNSAIKSKLRLNLRARRQSLSREQQSIAASQLMRRLIQLPAFRSARHIAGYIASDGEISPATLLRHADLCAKHCYLPKISQAASSNSMAFYPYHHRQQLRPNRYGIGEPPGLHRQAQAANKLDIVLLPLTAFDKAGRRLGMGGGYYDRAFAFKRNTKARKPIMIGLAHHCQEVNSLPSDDWDIPLDFIVTDRQVMKVKKR
ncbi:5-formyltetrahydrofolate cyclo-ligase [Zhongshania arctica]|uniref:5-formyltetrahydrofolate cyclo-ligase n=1 Tax=Zhongshania arctica TaxID=3238302 RepID=A0ABV3TSL5_9GAMM